MKCLRTTILLVMLMGTQAVQAVVLEGYEIPDAVPATGTSPELKLQGASVRDWYLVVNGYIGALYLENPSSDVAAIYADKGYQRMTFKLLFKKMSARRIANAFYESIQLNTTPEEQKKYEPELKEFFELVNGTLKRGEEGLFEYIPGKGVRIVIADVDKGFLKFDKEVFNLILRVWIGDVPPNKKFKQSILGLK